MAAANAEDFSDLHTRVLHFMGAFSSTQFAIDSVIGLYLQRRMPDLGSALQKQFIGKIRDDQRLTLFKAFAAEVCYEGDLTYFEPIYLRAKQVRDLIGHSMGVIGPVHSQDKPPCVIVSQVSNTKIQRVPSPLYPSTFVRLTADCEWTTEHVWRAGYMAEPDMFIDLEGKPAEPPVPSASPEGGEPLA